MDRPVAPRSIFATEVARVAGFAHVRIGSSTTLAAEPPRRRPSWPTLRSVARRKARVSTPPLTPNTSGAGCDSTCTGTRQSSRRGTRITDPLHHVTLNIRGVGGELYRPRQRQGVPPDEPAKIRRDVSGHHRDVGSPWCARRKRATIPGRLVAGVGSRSRTTSPPRCLAREVVHRLPAWPLERVVEPGEAGIHHRQSDRV